MRLLSHVAALGLLLLAARAAAFEGLLSAAGEVTRDAPVAPRAFGSPDWDVYSRTERLLAAVFERARACGARARAGVVGGEGGVGYVTLGGGGRIGWGKTRVMVVFGEHGRDFVTSEVALRIVEMVCGTDAGGGPGAAAASSLWNPGRRRLEIVIVPVANPNGRRIAQIGRYCEVGNGNDIDIGQNWERGWNSSSASSKAGPKAFSEPETVALRSIVASLKPTAFVSVRSGARAITTPWDCNADESIAANDNERLVRVAGAVTASHCQKCATGTLRNVTGHSKCGTGADYAYGTLGVPFVYTWYIYKDDTADGDDCFRLHNPSTPSEYERVVNNWAHAVFNFTDAVHNWMTVERSHGQPAAAENATRAAAKAAARRAEFQANGVPDPEVRTDIAPEAPDGANGAAGSSRGALRRSLVGPASVLLGGKSGGRGEGLMIWVFGEKRFPSAPQPGPVHALPQGPAAAAAGGGPKLRDRGVGTLNPANVANTAKSRLSTGPLPAASDTWYTLLSGWFGVAAAMVMFAAGSFFVRKHVFSPSHSRKSRFRSRILPVKNA